MAPKRPQRTAKKRSDSPHDSSTSDAVEAEPSGRAEGQRRTRARRPAPKNAASSSRAISSDHDPNPSLVAALREVTGLEEGAARELLLDASKTVATEDTPSSAVSIGLLERAVAAFFSKDEPTGRVGTEVLESRALRHEQDAAFEDALREDRERQAAVEARRADEERAIAERKRCIEDAAAARRLVLEEKREREQEVLRGGEDGRSAIAAFRVRLPDGRSLDLRRFDVREPVYALFDALDVQLATSADDAARDGSRALDDAKTAGSAALSADAAGTESAAAHGVRYPPGSYALAARVVSVLDGPDARVHVRDGDATRLVDAGLVGSTALFLVPS